MYSILQLGRPPRLPQSRPVHHHHIRTRFAAERIRESIVGRTARFVCGIFLAILLTAGVIVFILWLALRPHRPRFHVKGFSVSPLSFTLEIRNPNKNIAVYYYSMDADVFENELSVGSTLLIDGPLYQPPKNTTVVNGSVAVQSPDQGGGGGGSPPQGSDGIGPVRIEVRSKFRFRIAAWDTHKHVMHVSCTVEVGPDGLMVPGVSEKRCQIYFT